MPDFQTLTITLDRGTPWKTRLEIDGQPITNVFAIRVEQQAPDRPMTIELSTYGTQLVVNGDPQLFLKACCPVCRAQRGLIPTL